MEAEAGPIEARLSAFDISMVVFSLVVGIGIFRTPALVAQAAGGTALFYAAWVSAGLVSLVRAPAVITGWSPIATVRRSRSC